MAHSASAKKRIRQTIKRTERNRARRTRLRSMIKSVRMAIASGDAATARDALKGAQPIIHGSVSKGILHRNTADRTLRRLARQVKALA